MPSVLVQIPPFADSTSGEGRIFSRFFNEYCAVTSATSGEIQGQNEQRVFIRGGCPGLVDWGQKCRFHRHPTGLLGVDYCRRGEASFSPDRGPLARLMSHERAGGPRSGKSRVSTSNDQNRGPRLCSGKIGRFEIECFLGSVAYAQRPGSNPAFP